MVSEAKVGAQVPARIKTLLIKELINDWQGMQSFVVVCPVGLDAITTNQLRGALQAKNIKMTVVKNSLARLALSELDLAPASELFDAACAVCYGGESVVDVARELLDWSRKAEALKLRGAFVDGQVFVGDQFRRLATMPNRAELLARILASVTAPGRGIASALLASAGRIAGAIESLVTKLQEAVDSATPAEQSEVEEPVQSTESSEQTNKAEPEDTAQKNDATGSASDSDSQQQQSQGRQ